MTLQPLPLDAAAEFISDRFDATGRIAGPALDALLQTTRGHPQRTIMLAHYLWARTPRGGSADEVAWNETLDTAIDATGAHMRAIWKALPTNQRRIALALATSAGQSPYNKDTLARVGIKRNSVQSALDALAASADTLPNGEARLTDPLFEIWLERRGAL